MKQAMIITSLFITVFLVNPASAYHSYPDPTPQLRFSGILFPITTQLTGSQLVLPVYIEGQLWHFQVHTWTPVLHKSHDSISIRDLSGSSIRLYGPSALIHPLKDTAITTKLLTIEGQFDSRTRRLRVTAVQETPEIAKQY